jgi:hypothetical protein
MRRLDCTLSNPLKASNRPDPRFPPLPRAETPPIFPSFPLISNVHKRPVVDDPPAARCALLFALSNCSSTPSLSPRSAFSRSSLPLHTSKRVPPFLALVPGRSFYTSILLHRPSNPPGCNRPLSTRISLTLFAYLVLGKRRPTVSIAPGTASYSK